LQVKTEPGAISMTPSKVEETLLEVCKEHPQWIPPQDSTSMPPPKEYADHTLDKCAALAGDRLAPTLTILVKISAGMLILGQG